MSAVWKYFQFLFLIIFALLHLPYTVAYLSGIYFYLRCRTVRFLLFQMLKFVCIQQRWQGEILVLFCCLHVCNCQTSLVTLRIWLCGGLDLSWVENGNGKFLQGDAFEVAGTLHFGATTANAQLPFLKSATREKASGHKHTEFAWLLLVLCPAVLRIVNT